MKKMSFRSGNGQKKKGNNNRKNHLISFWDKLVRITKYAEEHNYQILLHVLKVICIILQIVLWVLKHR